MEEFDVSVIVPIYNSSKYLNECLESLSVQKILRYQFLCIDDGSIDESRQICFNFIEKDRRFEYHYSQHRGASHARNVGIQKVKGKYVCFLDSDDYLGRDSLFRLFTLAENYNVDCIKYNGKIVGVAKRWMLKSFKKRDELLDDFSYNDIFKYRDCRPFIWMHFIKSSLLLENRLMFNESLYIGEDQEYVIRYMSFVKRVLFISDKLVYHRINHYSIMKTMANDSATLYSQHFLMVKTVLSYNDYMSEDVANWVFDHLYWQLIKKRPSKEEIGQLVELLEYNSIIAYLSGRKCRLAKKLVNEYQH
jgi:glycosyltransferase involved in cell wall biosynthesis